MAASTSTGAAAQNKHSSDSSSYLSARPLVLGLAKILMVGLVPAVRAYPLNIWPLYPSFVAEEEPMPSGDPTLWIYLLVAVGLVLLGGAFAGLTIALMGQVRCYSSCYHCVWTSHCTMELTTFLFPFSCRMKSIYKSLRRQGNRLNRNMLVGSWGC